MRASLTRLLLRCSFWLLLLLAGLLLAARLLAPQATRLQPQVIEYLQRQLQSPVSMSAMQAGWRGARPYFLVHDLQLGDAGAGLYLGSVRVYVRPADLLRSDSNALQLEILDARLELQHIDTGWRLSGLSTDTESGQAITADDSRRRLLEQLLGRGDVSLVNTQLHIVSPQLPTGSMDLQVEYANLRQLPRSGEETALDALIRRPSSLPRRLTPEFSRAGEPSSRFLLQARVQPLPATGADTRVRPHVWSAGNSKSGREQSADLALQLRFTDAGLAIDGYLRLQQQALAGWDRLMPPGLAAALPATGVSSQLWFNWVENDYLQARGQLELVSGVANETVTAVPGISTDIELLWQHQGESLVESVEHAQKADYWRLLLDNIATPNSLPQQSWLLLGSNAQGGWSVTAEQLRPRFLASAAALTGTAGTMQNWVNINHELSRIDIPELIIDDQRRVLAARVNIADLLLHAQTAVGSDTAAVENLTSADARTDDEQTDDEQTGDEQTGDEQTGDEQTGRHAGASAMAPAIPVIEDCGPFKLQLSMRRQLGAFALHSDNSVCAMPVLWREPMVLEQLRVAGQLEQLSDGWRAATQAAPQAANLKTPDISLNISADLHQSAAGLALAVDAGLAAILAARVQGYMPLEQGKPGAISWIERALQGGWVRDLRMSWHRHSAAATTVDPLGLKNLQLLLDLDNVQLNFARNWPPGEQINTQVRITDGQLLANAGNGRLVGSRISDLDVRIEDLFDKQKLLLQAQVENDAEQMLDLLTALPITDKDLSRKDYSLLGPVTAEVDIGVDLANKNKLLYARGSARLQNVKAVTDQLTISNINGKLLFDDKGPQDSVMQAYWGDYPGTLSWVRSAAGPEIRLQGNFASKQVAHAALPAPVLIERYIGGRSNWNLHLLIGRDQPGVLVYSDLTGTEIRLPPPLSKVAAVRRPLRLFLPLTDGQRLIRLEHGGLVQQTVGDAGPSGLLSLALLQDEDHNLQGLSANFDDLDAQVLLAPVALSRLHDDVSMTKAGAVRASGHVAAFDPLAWGEVFLAYQKRINPALPKPGTQPSRLQLQTDLTVANVMLGARALGPLQLHIDNHAGAKMDNSKARFSDLWLTVQGDNLAGSATLSPTAEGVLMNVDMQRLYIPAPGQGLQALQQPVNGPSRLLDAQEQRWNGLTLNLIADDVRYQALDLGTVRLELMPVINGLALERMEARSDSINVTASGGWLRTGDEVESRLKMRLDSNDMGLVLTGLGYDELVRKAQTTMLLDVTWPGSLTEFAARNLQGSLDVRTGKGEMPKASPGAGRALGLLSLQALPQRLFLDFSDVFAEGLEFESAGGRFVFADGIASAENVKINAAAANISITGNTDLVAHTYDQTILVEPGTTMALPIIGAIAGGPIGAGAGFALQGLFGGAIGEISKVQYRITGPWQNPELTVYSDKPTVMVKD